MAPSKPIHPATIHFPIAFLTLAWGLDLITYAAPNLPAQITANIPVAADAHKASYYLLAMGLVTAVPAVVTGGVEAIKMISKQGMYESDGKTVKAKVKALFAHAIFNDIVLAVAAYIFFQRKAAVTGTVAGKLGASSAFEPEFWMVGAQGAIMALFFLAANIGGKLTYNFGVGFNALGVSKKTQ